MNSNKLLVTNLLLLLLCASGNGQNSVSTDTQEGTLEMDSILKQGPEYNLVTPLIGNWKVVQTIYSKEDGKIISRDTFKVERKMSGNFLQEVMQPIQKNETNAFTRTSYLNYNRTNVRWEYVVLDTRYPIMMFETSTNPLVSEEKEVHLYMDAFIVPPFLGKKYAGMFAKEHRVITFKGNDINIHRQYWILPGEKEFLAIEYVFKRE